MTEAFDGREPTSHERMTGKPWDASYQDGPAPWDIGTAQPAVVRLASEDGAFTGAVLDAGCGTGENAFHLAALGVPVLGVDAAPTALAMARAKAEERGSKAEFLWADALALDRLNRTFRTVLDCGLFHTFDADERPGYVASLASVTEPGSRLYVLCFSDEGSNVGPHPVSRSELSAAFSNGHWRVDSIAADLIETRVHGDDVAAWLARIERV